jgi:hypothetical protein
MKPSLLNAPFNPREYQRRMDEIVRVKHGFVSPSKVIAPAPKVVKAEFYKWPAYVTAFYVYNDDDCSLGFIPPTAFGKQWQDGTYVYVDYFGNPSPFSCSAKNEYRAGIHRHRFISPNLCALLISNKKPIRDKEQIEQLRREYPSLTLEEWEALPEETWH